MACELAATAVEVAITAGYMPATTAGALYQVATRLFYVNVLMLGVAVAAGALAAAALPRWVAGLGVATGAVLAVSGFAVAAPHGPLGPPDLLGDFGRCSPGSRGDRRGASPGHPSPASPERRLAR